MKICIFGDYDVTYSRNRVITKGLISAGAELSYYHISESGWRSIYTVVRDIRKIIAGSDVIFVMYSNSRCWVPLLWILTKRPIVWDAFFSRYDAIINDRKLASPYSLKALYHWVSDFLSVRFASLILLDTTEHIRYFKSVFGRGDDAYLRVLVGAEDPLLRINS